MRRMRKKTISLLLLTLVISLGLIILLDKRLENNTNSSKPDNPIPKLETFVENNPENIEALHELALRYYRTEREYRKADVLLRKILELDPKNSLAMLRRAIVMEEQGLFSEAIAQYRNILLIEPKNPSPLFAISQLSLLSDRRQALEYAQKAVDSGKENPEKDKGQQGLNERFRANWLRAVVAFEDGSKNDPLGASLKILDLIPSHRLKLEVCSWAVQQEQNTNKEKRLQLLEKKGKLAIYYGMQQEAIDTFEQLVQVDPNYLYGYILLGDRLAIENNAESLVILEKRIRSARNSSLEKKIIAALILKAKGQTQQAIIELEGLQGNGKYEGVLLYQMGLLHEEIGENDIALKYFKDFNNIKAIDSEYWLAVSYDINSSINTLSKNDR